MQSHMECFDRYIGSFLDRFARVLGPVLVGLAVGLIMLCTYTFFAFVVPFQRVQNGLTGTGELALSLTGIFFLVNTLYNYYMCVVTDAGIPPLAADTAETGNSMSTSANSALGNRLSGYSYERTRAHSSMSDSEDEEHHIEGCSKCYRTRIARTHHCSICKSCIVKMDHHCPWIYNCVGYGNYKYFYLFLFHLAVVDAFYVITAMEPLLYALQMNKRVISEDEDDLVMTFAARSWVILTVALAAAMGIAVLAFLVFHTYLILNNQTTIEFLQSRGRAADHKLRTKGKFCRNKYDLGRARNWDEVFGYGNGSFWSFRWALSPFHKRTVDGIPIKTFPTISNHHSARPSE